MYDFRRQFFHILRLIPSNPDPNLKSITMKTQCNKAIIL